MTRAQGKAWLLGLVVFCTLVAVATIPTVASVAGLLLGAVFFGGCGYAAYQGIRDRRAMAAHRRGVERPRS